MEKTKKAPVNKGHQRQHVQIHAIGTGHADRSIAFDLRRDGENARRQSFPKIAPQCFHVRARSQAHVDAIQAADRIECPLRRGDIHQPQRLRVRRFRQDAKHPQRFRGTSDRDLQRIAAAQLQRLGGGATQVNAVRSEELEHAIADIADEGGLQSCSLERIEAQHFERVVTSGKRNIEFQHRAQRTDGGVVCQIHELLAPRSLHGDRE